MHLFDIPFPFKLSPLLLLFTISQSIGCTGLGLFPMERQFAALRSSTLYDELDEEDSIGGKDSNNNGIRDDIETWIKKQEYNDDQKRALLFAAKTHRKVLLIDLTNDEEYNNALLYKNASLSCAFDKFNSAGRLTEVDVIEAANVNTKKRYERYSQFHLAYSEHSPEKPRPNTLIDGKVACNMLLEKFGDPLKPR